MAEFDQNNTFLPKTMKFDGAGCISTVMVLVLVLFIAAVVIGDGNDQIANPPLTATKSATLKAQVLARIASPTVAAATYTVTPLPSSTSTATATVTETATPTQRPSASATSTLFPTATERPSPTFTPPPLPTPRETYSWTLKVPILMYHYISMPPEDADVYRVDLSVEPEAFREQMAYLAENGYTPIDLYDLSLAITNKIDLPAKPVIITLDDGYRDNYENAFPILQEFGFKATFFIVTDFIDQGHDPYMTWPMLEEMAAAGMRIESHSKTHPDLRGQEHDYLVWQILGSQETIAAHIGYTPRYFSYPSGRYDEDSIAVLDELDFWGAVTTASGKWHGFDDRYEWTRLRVRHTTPLAEFVDLVGAGNAVGGKEPGAEPGADSER